MSNTEYEDVTLRLPKGLKEEALADAATIEEYADFTLSEITTHALYYWINA